MEGKASLSRKQLHRMSRIVAALKQSDNVTQKRLLDLFAETEMDTHGPLLTCGEKTLQRDLRILREEFGCPFEYDRSMRVYTLSDRQWSFPVPAVLNDDELFAIVLGGKMAKDMLPPRLAARISRAVDEVVSCNSTERAAPGLVDSLKILTGTASDLQEEIFLAVFDAWTRRRVIHIVYEDEKGKRTERDVEPQTLIFHDMQWSVKGRCHLRNEDRTFNLLRMVSAEATDRPFKRDRALAESITIDTFPYTERTEDVVIRLTRKGRQFARTCILHTRQSFEEQPDGMFLMRVPTVARQVLVPWVLRQAGEAAVVSPPEMAEEVRNGVRCLMESCGMG